VAGCSPSFASLALVGVLVNAAAAFSPAASSSFLPHALRPAAVSHQSPSLLAPPRQCRGASLGPVMMGRAAAVREKKKGKTDAIKNKLNSRFGKMATSCVKSGGSDPSANAALGKILEQAQKASVPKKIMENAMKRATNKDQADFKEGTFEIYAHGGAAFVVDVLTDNNNRAAGDIRTVVNKQKLKLAESGSVAFNFDRVGQVTVESDKSEDDMMEAAMEAGADDLEAVEDEEEGTKGFHIYTDTTDMMQVSAALEAAGVKVTETKFIYKPKAPVECSDEDIDLNLKAIDFLEELDDVDAVHTNML